MHCVGFQQSLQPLMVGGVRGKQPAQSDPFERSNHLMVGVSQTRHSDYQGFKQGRCLPHNPNLFMQLSSSWEAAVQDEVSQGYVYCTGPPSCPLQALPGSSVCVTSIPISLAKSSHVIMPAKVPGRLNTEITVCQAMEEDFMRKN